MTKKSFPSTDADKFIVRLPGGMRSQIAENAKANNRSMNAEIVGMLQQAMDARPPDSVPVVDVDALAEALAPKLAARLKDQT